MNNQVVSQYNITYVKLKAQQIFPSEDLEYNEFSNVLKYDLEI